MRLLLPLALVVVLSGSAGSPTSFSPFVVSNYDGREISNATLLGKTTIVVPTYAKCVFACPMVTFLLTELDSELGGPPDLQYLHVSVQPSQDTTDEILEHFTEHGIDAPGDPRWLFANGPEKAIQRLLEDTDIQVARTLIDGDVLIEHTLRVFVVGPRGEILADFDTYFWDEEEMLHALRFAAAPQTSR